jgi:hypothetical protein
MALLSTLFATFLGGSVPFTGPGDRESGPGIRVALCRDTAPGASGEEEEATVDLLKLSQVPKVWIGVRVSTVPDALAAHLQRGALMIVNVAEDSPAERAGLDRFDVVLSFGGREITGMQDLLDAIREHAADQPARMIVIKGGAERILTVTPVPRDPAVTPVFKYEEPEVPGVDPLQKYFGHRVKIGPDGNIVILPQGRLDRLPGEIKSLLDRIPELDRLQDLDELPFGFSLDLDGDDFPGFRFFTKGQEFAEDSALTITITDDSGSTTIRRDEDGIFTVEREDAEGNRSSATYEDVEQLREHDQDAYKLYRRSTRRSGISTIVLPPDLQHLGDWQRQFEIELKAKLDRAHEQADHLLDKAQQQIEIHRHRLATEGDDAIAHTKTVILSVNDGRITLTITEDGERQTYEFDSPAEFEQSQPELYEQYRPYLDEQAP